MRPADVNRMAKVVREIVEERERQVDVEGFDPEHDDDHSNGALAEAAAAYAQAAASAVSLSIPVDLQWHQSRKPPPNWPWEAGWWKPKSPRADLIRAAALIVAEIERLDRAGAPASGDDAPEGAVLADLKVGDVLVADARFHCIDAGAQVTVDATEHGNKFVICRDGMHLLDGQVDAFGRLRGLALVPAGDAP